MFWSNHAPVLAQIPRERNQTFLGRKVAVSSDLYV